jgi:hypothetical protein
LVFFILLNEIQILQHFATDRFYMQRPNRLSELCRQLIAINWAVVPSTGEGVYLTLISLVGGGRHTQAINPIPDFTAADISVLVSVKLAT